MQCIKWGLPWLLSLIWSSASLADSAYLLKEGDLLAVSVWGEENLEHETRVLPDGSLSFPLVGSMSVKGLSAPEVERLIAEKLAAFVPEPTVSVMVLDTNGNRIYILGNVNNPGAFVMTSPLSVMQALSLAGGLSTFADENDILVLRQSSEGQSKLPVRYKDILSGKSFSTNHMLKAGDTVLVP